MTTITTKIEKPFPKFRYPLLALLAEEEINKSTRAGQDTRRMLVKGHPVADIFQALEKAASYHGREFGRSIAYDYVSGDNWLATAVNARRLLDSELGPVENGLLERYFWHICSFAGFHKVEVEKAIGEK